MTQTNIPPVPEFMLYKFDHKRDADYMITHAFLAEFNQSLDSLSKAVKCLPSVLGSRDEAKVLAAKLVVLMADLAEITAKADQAYSFYVKNEANALGSMSAGEREAKTGENYRALNKARKLLETTESALRILSTVY